MESPSPFVSPVIRSRPHHHSHSHSHSPVSSSPKVLRTTDYGDHFMEKSYTPINKNTFRPVDFQTKVELDKFFGQSKLQKRQLALHTKDEDGRWWFDGIEREENRALLGEASSPSVSLAASRRESRDIPSSPSTPNLASPSQVDWTTARRRSSTYLLGVVAPLQVVTPDRATFFQPYGMLQTSEAQRETAPHRRARMKRSHSATGRGNVIGDTLPGSMSFNHTLAEVVGGDHEPGTETIRLPTFLPLPHRLVSTKELDDAFGTVQDAEATVFPSSSPPKGLSVSFAEGTNTTGSRTRSTSDNSVVELGGNVKKDRPRPARLHLPSRQVSMGLSETAAALALNSDAANVITTSGVGGGKELCKGRVVVVAAAIGTGSTTEGSSGLSMPDSRSNVQTSSSSSSLSSSSAGNSPTAMRKRPRPWSTCELSPSSISRAFAGMRTTIVSPNGGSTTGIEGSGDDETGEGGITGRTLAVAGILANSAASPFFSPFASPVRTSPITPRMRAYSLESSPSAVAGGFPFPYGTSPTNSATPMRRGGSSTKGLNGGTLEASKGELFLGANPLNRNLLAPGGLPTGEGVYDGLIMPGPSVHLGSDDEEDQEEKRKIARGKEEGARGMRKWLGRKKSHLISGGR